MKAPAKVVMGFFRTDIVWQILVDENVRKVVKVKMKRERGVVGK